MIELLTNPLAATVLSVVLAGIAYLGRRLVHGRKYADFLERLGGYARLAVIDVHATYVEAIKAASADGTLTDAEKKEARGLAVDKLLSYAKLGKLAGLAERDLAGAAVEAALIDAKQDGAFRPPQ